jgi:hypothetical protein
LLAIVPASPPSRQQLFETKKSATAMSIEPKSALSAIVLQNIEIARRSHRGCSHAVPIMRNGLSTLIIRVKWRLSICCHRSAVSF